VRYELHGFTLIELVLVMAIVGILAVVGIGSYTQATMKSRDIQRKNDLNQISKAIESFNNDLGRYPQSEVVGGYSVMTCPQADSTEVACGTRIYGYIRDALAVYMENVPVDPNTAKRYVYIAGDDNSTYSLLAALENTEDRDVVVDAEGNTTDWGESCGVVNCNYKITELGLVKIK
jgi:prepilin-type N-terminal cleavage/methylation domain-containing protein